MARVASGGHPHIIAYRGKGTATNPHHSSSAAGGDTPCPVLALEYADGGDMLSAVRAAGHRGLGDSDVTRTGAAQLASALAYCHAHGVAHRDVKPENVLRCGGGGSPCWKLADFGAASVSKADPAACGGVAAQLIQSSRAIGSDAYAAPEVIAVIDACVAANAGHGPTSLPVYEVYGVDVWSFGVTLFVLASGRAPFKRASGADTAFLGFCAATQPGVLSPRAAAVAPGWRWPSHFNGELVDLLTGCLQVDPRARLSMAGVCGAAWLAPGGSAAAAAVPDALVLAASPDTPPVRIRRSSAAGSAGGPPYASQQSPTNTAASDAPTSSRLSSRVLSEPSEMGSSRFPSLASAACRSENTSVGESDSLHSSRPKRLSGVGATPPSSMPVVQEQVPLQASGGPTGILPPLSSGAAGAVLVPPLGATQLAPVAAMASAVRL